MAEHTDLNAFAVNALFRVEGKVALITGGGSGIGLMAAQALAANGAKVYICGRSEDKLENVVAAYGTQLEGKPGSLIPLTADVTSKEDIEKLFATISEKETKLDILVLNAGVQLGEPSESVQGADALKKELFSPKAASFDTWTETYRTNVPQLFFVSTAFLPLLEAASGNGHSATILTITSMSGIMRKSQNQYYYNSSKAAAIHLTKMLAVEFAESGVKVRVNSIAPGVFPSEMTAGKSDDKQKSSLPKESVAEDTTASRPGKDTDMANAVLFAVTNDYLNGVIIPLDGGTIVLTGSL